MAVRITLMVLRVVVLLALILGLLMWFGVGGALVPVHMLLGILVVLSLWVLGGFAFTIKGGVGIGIGAIVLGLIVLLFGLNQRTILVGDLHWLIQVIHLLLGLSAAGMGEAIAGRYKRLNVATQSAQQQ
ncbi:hypothetical protein KSF_021340 [Reticulibacter mediterranei]|uniref:Uncharacterized protein n=1 Tax=Reticulibacter mediterranei TaxID=2778369 RepID=A0A8J3IKX7_9CHLR|nr:hypothetical protein [Reticulibacter mediterranei]GHO92086.1 hypothetical protein KSF_021340 [Reticulibacter mediterranei]